ncbi:hypothetical protein [Campylobacter phage CJLB-14]|nr:hypothetical protein [Campylobacter phage CJLB-14]
MVFPRTQLHKFSLVGTKSTTTRPSNFSKFMINIYIID